MVPGGIDDRLGVASLLLQQHRRAVVEGAGLYQLAAAAARLESPAEGSMAMSCSDGRGIRVEEKRDDWIVMRGRDKVGLPLFSPRPWDAWRAGEAEDARVVSSGGKTPFSFLFWEGQR